MNKLPATLLVCVSLLASASTFAKESEEYEKAMMAQLKKMDTNGDGMISKDEFMKYHEAMYDAMKKSKGGMVDMNEMKMMMHKHMRNMEGEASK